MAFFHSLFVLLISVLILINLAENKGFYFMATLIISICLTTSVINLVLIIFNFLKSPGSKILGFKWAIKSIIYQDLLESIELKKKSKGKSVYCNPFENKSTFCYHKSLIHLDYDMNSSFNHMNNIFNFNNISFNYSDDLYFIGENGEKNLIMRENKLNTCVLTLITKICKDGFWSLLDNDKKNFLINLSMKLIDDTDCGELEVVGLISQFSAIFEDIILENYYLEGLLDDIVFMIFIKYKKEEFKFHSNCSPRVLEKISKMNESPFIKKLNNKILENCDLDHLSFLNFEKSRCLDEYKRGYNLFELTCYLLASPYFRIEFACNYNKSDISLILIKDSNFNLESLYKVDVKGVEICNIKSRIDNGNKLSEDRDLIKNFEWIYNRINLTTFLNKIISENRSCCFASLENYQSYKPLLSDKSLRYYHCMGFKQVYDHLDLNLGYFERFCPDEMKVFEGFYKDGINKLKKDGLDLKMKLLADFFGKDNVGYLDKYFKARDLSVMQIIFIVDMVIKNTNQKILSNNRKTTEGLGFKNWRWKRLLSDLSYFTESCGSTALRGTDFKVNPSTIALNIFKGNLKKIDCCHVLSREKPCIDYLARKLIEDGGKTYYKSVSLTVMSYSLKPPSVIRKEREKRIEEGHGKSGEVRKRNPTAITKHVSSQKNVGFKNFIGNNKFAGLERESLINDVNIKSTNYLTNGDNSKLNYKDIVLKTNFEVESSAEHINRFSREIKTFFDSDFFKTILEKEELCKVKVEDKKPQDNKEIKKPRRKFSGRRKDKSGFTIVEKNTKIAIRNKNVGKGFTSKSVKTSNFFEVLYNQSVKKNTKGKKVEPDNLSGIVPKLEKTIKNTIASLVKIEGTNKLSRRIINKESSLVKTEESREIYRNKVKAYEEDKLRKEREKAKKEEEMRIEELNKKREDILRKMEEEKLMKEMKAKMEEEEKEIEVQREKMAELTRRNNIIMSERLKEEIAKKESYSTTIEDLFKDDDYY